MAVNRPSGTPARRSGWTRFFWGAAILVLAVGFIYIGDRFFTRAASGEVIVLWDGASIPSGWTCISCSSGDPLFGAFPRASSTYASATSSADTQGHSASFVTSTAGAVQAKNQSTAGTALDDDAHTHTVSGISVVASDIRPPFKNLKFIRAATTTLPNGTIAIFDVASSSLPADWSYYSGMENNYLRADNATSTGGSANHLHSLQATADAVTATHAVQNGGTQVAAAAAHSHSVSGTTPTATNAPPFADVVFGKLAATSSIPTGLIAIFDASLPAGWEPMSHATGTLNGRFLRGAQTFGATGGSASHSHTTTTVTSGLPSNTATTRTGATTNVADDAHTHDLTFNNISSETSLPVYRDVILGKKQFLLTLTVGTAGTQTATTTIPSGDFHVGGAFTFVSNSSTDVTQVRIHASGTVDEQNDLSDLRLFYKQEATCSTSIPGGVTEFTSAGLTFDGSGYATATGTMSVATSQICMYVRLDVGTSAGADETLEIEIEDPSGDVVVSGGVVEPDTLTAIAGTTTLASGVITVGTTGSQTATTTIPSSSFHVGGAFTFLRSFGNATVTRIMVRASGTVDASADLSDLQLFYKEEGSCSATIPGDATAFNAAGVGFNTSGTATTTGSMPVGTSQVCVYARLSVGSGASPGETLEIEIINPSADVTVSLGTVAPAATVALAGTTTLEAAGAPFITVGSEGNQRATTTAPASDQWSGGAFTFARSTGNATVTQIAIHENGSINANANLSDLRLFYKEEAACATSSIPGDAIAFNSAGVSWNGSEGAVATGTMPVATNQVCVYARFDVGSGASSGETILIRIANASTDVVVSAGDVNPAGAVNLSGSTEVPQPRLTQQHFRFYTNPDLLAPTSSKAAEDAVAGNIVAHETLRLRMNVAMDDTSLATSSLSLRLQFAPKGAATSCLNILGGSFTDLGQLASTTVWRGADVGTNADDGDTLSSTLLASSTVAQSYEEENPGAANPRRVPTGGVAEWDWAIENNGATSGASYCFRLVESDGTPLDSYARLPELTVAPPATWKQAEDGTISGVQKNQSLRLRIQIANEGTAATSTVPLLEFATSTAGPWTAAPADPACNSTAQAFRICDSAYFADGDPTSNRLTAEGTTFVPGEMLDASNPGATTTLAVDDYTEYEWNLQATDSSIFGQTYFFRLSNNGASIGLYQSYAQLTMEQDPVLTQNYFRFYVDSDALSLSDVWPAGAPALAENAAITSADGPPKNGDRLRLRMSVNVSVADVATSSRSFDLQFAERITTCAAVATSSWADVGQPASSTVWRGFDGSPSDGATLPGTLLSVSDRTGTYEEANPSAANPQRVQATEDVEYDWILQNNGAVAGGAYCFRMTESDGTVLDGYDFYPTITTAEPVHASRNWRWYDDESSETPVVALAAETSSPTNIEFQNVIKLRLTIKETNGVANSNVKFKLQFSESSDFSGPTFDVAETAGCQPASRWCYADGGGADNGIITTRLLSDSDTDGTHNESGTSTSAFTHPADAAAEYEFTIRHAGANSNTAYFFRAVDTGSGLEVPLDTGETYPSLVTGGSSLTFTISGVGRSVVTEGIETDATSTATTIPFGTLAADFETEAAQRFLVSTNATQGYQIFAFQDQELLNSYGDNIPPFGATNASPSGWASTCVTTTTGCYGYHAGDDTLAGGSARFAANNTYARFESTPREVVYSSGPVSNESTDLVFKLQVRNLQESGQYQHSLTYIIVPVF